MQFNFDNNLNHVIKITALNRMFKELCFFN